jgi:hypothetical protein
MFYRTHAAMPRHARATTVMSEIPAKWNAGGLGSTYRRVSGTRQSKATPKDGPAAPSPDSSDS